MKEFKIITLYTFLALAVIGGIMLAVVLPPEGKTVEYRLEYETNQRIGTYPVIRQVIENETDKWIYLPDLTMEQGVDLVNKLNRELKGDPCFKRQPAQ